MFPFYHLPPTTFTDDFNKWLRDFPLSPGHPGSPPPPAPPLLSAGIANSSSYPLSSLVFSPPVIFISTPWPPPKIALPQRSQTIGVYSWPTFHGPHSNRPRASTLVCFVPLSFCRVSGNIPFHPMMQLCTVFPGATTHAGGNPTAMQAYAGTVCVL